MPTAGIEVIVKDKYHCLTRVSDNFFVGSNLGKFSTPLHVRLTSITGEQVKTVIQGIRNDVSIPSGVQFKGIKGESELTEATLFVNYDMKGWMDEGKNERTNK